MASLCIPRHFSRRFPLLSELCGNPPHLPCGARLAHVTAQRASARGRGWRARVYTRARRASFSAPRGARRRWRGREGLWVSLRSLLVLLIWEGEYMSGPATPPFSLAALALPLPAGQTARVSTPPLFQNGGCERPPLSSRGRGQGRGLPRPFSGGSPLHGVLRTRPPGSPPPRLLVVVVACDAAILVKEGTLCTLFFPLCILTVFLSPHVTFCIHTGFGSGDHHNGMFVSNLPS